MDGIEATSSSPDGRSTTGRAGLLLKGPLASRGEAELSGIRAEDAGHVGAGEDQGLGG